MTPCDVVSLSPLEIGYAWTERLGQGRWVHSWSCGGAASFPGQFSSLGRDGGGNGSEDSPVWLRTVSSPPIGQSLAWKQCQLHNHIQAEGTMCKYYTVAPVCSGHCLRHLALYPGFLTPAFVICSTNVGDGLVKLIMWNDIAGCWVDMWRSGTFLLYSCKVAFWTQERSPWLSNVEHSVVLQSMFAIGSALTCGFSGNVPLHHTSRYVIARDSVLPGLPPC